MSKFYNDEIKPREDIGFVEEKPVVEEKTVVEKKPVVEETVQCFTGVINVSLLNIRVAPNIDSDVVTVVKEGTILEISDEESTDDFYKVYLANGVDGFCMKQFVTLME